MPIDSAQRRNRKKKTPPAIGIGTKFNKTADTADNSVIPIMANRFLEPHVRDRTRLDKLASAPYDIAEIRVVGCIVSLQTSCIV